MIFREVLLSEQTYHYTACIRLRGYNFHQKFLDSWPKYVTLLHLTLTQLHFPLVAQIAISLHRFFVLLSQYAFWYRQDRRVLSGKHTLHRVSDEHILDIIR